MKNIAPILIVAAVAAAVIVLVARRPIAPIGSAVQVIAGVGTSGSERQKSAAGGTLMGHSIAQLARLAGRLDQNRDLLTVFRVDREAREFYDQSAPRSREKFQWLLVRETKPGAKPGSFPAKFWTKAAERAQDATMPVAICFFGDGDNDDLRAESQHEMQRAAKMLAANPRIVAVHCYGASSKNWDYLSECFAALGKRLHRHGPDEMDTAPLVAELEAARQGTGQRFAQR